MPTISEIQGALREAAAEADAMANDLHEGGFGQFSDDGKAPYLRHLAASLDGLALVPVVVAENAASLLEDYRQDIQVPSDRMMADECAARLRAHIPSEQE